MSDLNRRHFIQSTTLLSAGLGFDLARAQSAAEWVFGSSMALSGPLAGFGAHAKAGIEIAVHEINQAGGIHGRRLRAEVLDDAYQADRAVANVKKLAADPRVLAMVGNMGTPTVASSAPAIVQSGLALIGPLTGSSLIRQAQASTFFHIRPSYAEEIQQMIAKILAMGVNSIALIYVDNPYGKEVLAGVQQGLANKVKLVAAVPVAADGSNLMQGIKQVLASNPALVVIGVVGGTTAPVIKAIREASRNILLVGLSATITAQDANQLSAQITGMALPAIFRDPAYSSDELSLRFKKAAEAAGQSANVSGGSIETYIDTYVLAEGLRRAGRDPSRASLIQALSSLHDWRMGNVMVNFTKSAPFINTKSAVEFGVVNSRARLVF